MIKMIGIDCCIAATYSVQQQMSCSGQHKSLKIFSRHPTRGQSWGQGSSALHTFSPGLELPEAISAMMAPSRRCTSSGDMSVAIMVTDEDKASRKRRVSQAGLMTG